MLLKFENVSKSYGRVRALHKVSFNINQGEIVGLIGANGAGKTTTVLHIVRYLVPDEGRITLKGKPVSQYDDASYPVTYMPDTPIYYEELTVNEHLKLLASVYGKNKKDVDNLIERLELEEHLDKIPDALSKGTKQKLMIACAALRNFDLFVADEPFTGLDPKQIRVLKDIFIEQRETGKTVLLSTHLLDVIESFCDRYIFLHKGVILAEGTKEDIAKAYGLNNYTLEELYLEITGEDIRSFGEESEADDMDS
ncbi:MAG: ABC transporter ATP-binding protein [Peptococcaceae bacterium]|nr:ABC transporter ATP-binding protein [Peptococcaceae bacterium]